MNQSLQEVNRIFEEWTNNFAPKDLLQTPENINALVEYVTLHFGKVVSITNLDAALAALPSLARAPKKTALEREVEFRTKELQRRQREAAENAVPFNHAEKVQEQAAKATLDKEAAAIQSLIKSAIDSYECYRGPNRVDITGTDSRKKSLWAYHAANKHRRDQKKVLAEIRTTILNFPDPNERSRQ
jgi:hypothetical protein